MEDGLLEVLYRIVDELSGFRRAPRERFSGGVIALTYLWAVLHERPMNWACDRRNWPAWGVARGLPSPTTLCNRRRTPAVRRLLDAIESRVLAVADPRLVRCFTLDAKPLPISAYSKDRHAKRGYAYDGIARGYKLFALADDRGNLLAYRVGAMNAAEPVIARRLIKTLDTPGYILADAAYDSAPLHAAVASHPAGLQLVAPRKSPGTGTTPRARHPARLRSIDLLEGTGRFGPELYARRTAIERLFARLTTAPSDSKACPVGSAPTHASGRGSRPRSSSSPSITST